MPTAKKIIASALTLLIASPISLLGEPTPAEALTTETTPAAAPEANPSTLSITPSPTLDAVDPALAARATAFCEAISAAFAANDAATVGRLMADNAMHVPPMGWLLTKAQFMQDMQEGRLQFSNEQGTAAYQLTSPVEVRAIPGSPQAVIATGTIEACGMRDGQAISGQFRYTRTLIDDNGTLREVFSQMTPLRPAGQA